MCVCLFIYLFIVFFDKPHSECMKCLEFFYTRLKHGLLNVKQSKFTLARCYV